MSEDDGVPAPPGVFRQVYGWLLAGLNWLYDTLIGQSGLRNRLFHWLFGRYSAPPGVVPPVVVVPPVEVPPVAARPFLPVSDKESKGYWLWLPIAFAIAVVEITGAISDDLVPWKTISRTIGHLEDLWHPVALIVVALIALVVYAGVGYREAANAERTRMLLNPNLSNGAFLYGLAVIFGAILVGIIAGLAGASEIVISYWMYGVFSFFGIIVPSAHALKTDKEPTLFATVYALSGRIPWFKCGLALGMAVLFLHLAIYPWPDITHDSTTIEGLNAQQAREQAEAYLHPSAARYETVERGSLGGTAAWIVNFYPRDASEARCTVVVLRKGLEKTENELLGGTCSIPGSRGFTPPAP